MATKTSDYQALFNEYNAVSNDDPIILGAENLVANAFGTLVREGYDPRHICVHLVGVLTAICGDAVIVNACALRKERID